ncbi:MAG: ATP-binding protein [Planctomycetota bacterium]
MTAVRIPTNAKQLAALVREGEGQALEFKRSTGELKEGMQALCAFLNGSGGLVLFGVRSEGTIEGQAVSDQTLREIAQAADSFEPAVHVLIQRIKVEAGREVVVAAVEGGRDVRPFTYEGRAYERMESTTRRMRQAKHTLSCAGPAGASGLSADRQRLAARPQCGVGRTPHLGAALPHWERSLLDRAHGTHRWENEPAEGVELRDIDRDEVFRIVEAAKAAGRLIGPVGTQLADVLDRLRLRRDGRVLQAVVVLFGKEFLPDYPQCELRMARFRGTDKTEFLDQRHVRGPAFKLLEEAQLFCQRHLPIPGKIVPGKLQRVDTPLIPPDAMREILVNALIHRDYSIAGGAISLAIFDDRVEVWSAGTYPTGIRPEMLTRQHQSVLRNPIIADIFHRAGLIEQWGRGTNRVVEMCRKAGISLPVFQENGPFAVVTFPVRVGETAQVGAQDEVQVGTKSGLSEDQVEILRLSRQKRTLVELMNARGRHNRTKFRDSFIKPLLEEGFLELTIPDKPRSRMQRYRTTEAGQTMLTKRKSNGPKRNRDGAPSRDRGGPSNA